MRIIVTGGSGFLGRAVIERLKRDGMKPMAMTLPGEDVKGLNTVIRGDVTDPDSLDLPEHDAVIHCAGILESSHPSEEMMMKVNHTGTRNMFDAALKKGCRKFIFISSISALGPHGSRERPLTEKMDPDPCDSYGRSKLEAERYLKRASEDAGTTVVVLRPSVLYGPGMNLNSSGMKIFTSIRKGIMPLVGSGDTVLNMLYVDNLVEAIMLSLGVNEGYHIYHVSEAPYSQSLIIETIERRMKRIGHRRYPKSLLWILTLLSEVVSPLLKGPPPLSWTKYRALTGSIWAMSSDRIREELGFSEIVSLEEGVDRTCSFYGW